MSFCFYALLPLIISLDGDHGSESSTAGTTLVIYNNDNIVVVHYPVVISQCSSELHPGGGGGEGGGIYKHVEMLCTVTLIKYYIALYNAKRI